MKFFKKVLIAFLSIGLLTVPSHKNVETVEAAADNKVVYLEDVTGWASDNAKFAVWHWKTGGNGTWSSFMKKIETRENFTLYYTEISSSSNNLIFVRLNSSSSTPDWNNKWNQTKDLTLGNENVFKVKGWGSNDVESWGEYKPCVVKLNFDGGQYIEGNTTHNEIEYYCDAGNGSIDISRYVPIKNGYTFKGWKDENNKPYNGTYTYAFDGSNYSASLTAVWEKNVYNVTLNVLESTIPVEGVVHGTTLREVVENSEIKIEIEKTGFHVGKWSIGLDDKITQTMSINAISYCPVAVAQPTAELAFHYEYDERYDVVKTVDQVKLRLSSGNLDSTAFKGVSSFGISVTVGDKTNSKEWTEETVGKSSDANGEYYKWSLILNNIPNDYYESEISYSCYVKFGEIIHTISSRTITIKDLANAYVTEHADQLNDVQKTMCGYLANVGYATSEEGINELLENNVEYIILAYDIEVSELFIDNKKVTIDLNGYSIKATKEPGEHTTPDGKINYTSLYAIYAKNNSVVNIIGEGEVYGGTGADDNTAVRASGNSVVNIYNGEYSTGIDGGEDDGKGLGETTLYVTDTSTINIYGGTFSSENTYHGIYFILNPQENSEATFNVYGGTFIGYNPASNYTGQNFVAKGYEVTTTEENGINHYTVTKA